MLENTSKERITFSKKEKRLALIELAKGKSCDEIFKIIFEKKKLKSKDKKYFSKLLFKWKNEMYKNKEILNLLSQKLDDTSLEYEIDSFDFDTLEDDLILFIKNQMKET